MWALVVTVAFLIAGAPESQDLHYNKQTWDTQAACEAFVKSDEGQASLERLKVAVIAQTGDTNPTITPACKSD